MQDSLLYNPARHEPLRPNPWDAQEALAEIERIVADTEARLAGDRYWPPHPLDREDDGAVNRVETPLYHGASGVFWALNYLQSVGATSQVRNHAGVWDQLLAHNRAWLGNGAERERASFMMGDTPIEMMRFDESPDPQTESALDVLIAGNLEHPSRELMWGSPGTLLAALFLHERTGNSRWVHLFRVTAAKLWSQLEWSAQYSCAYWTQDLYGRRFTFLDAVHGFVATTVPLIRGCHLLDPLDWTAWQNCIVNTVHSTVQRQGPHANWRTQLEHAGDEHKKLLQFCHGAPGFIICLAALPATALDDLLLAAGETTWTAGPLAKGSNLCHGTGGNGYALLKLYQRTQDAVWLERARAFAMHGIAQTQDAGARHGHLRYSLWTGDLGFAIYLWDCVRAQAQFPTLDVFYGTAAAS